MKKQLKCIIVDDDAISREVVRQCIATDSRLQLIGTYHNALEAKMALTKKDIDLIFLDVEMPEMTGFELLDSYADIPQVIMVTSKKDYAFDAFKYDVVDFLSKPLDQKRFDKAVSRAVYYAENLSHSQKEEQSIIIKSEGVLVKLSVDDIDYIEAMGDYIKVVVGEKRYVVHSTMKAFMAELPESFLRVHKSYIVNLDKVLEMDDTYLIGEYFNLPVSRSYKSSVKTRFNS